MLFVVLFSVPGSSVGVDMYYNEIRLEEVLKISEGKAATTALNALHLIFWPHLCGEDP